MPTTTTESPPATHRETWIDWVPPEGREDALPPNALTQMVRQAIVSEIDVAQWNAAMEIEALERQTLESIARIHFKPGTEYTFKDDAA